jgi:hypothetical protein
MIRDVLSLCSMVVSPSFAGRGFAMIIFLGVAYTASADETRNTKLQQFASFDGVQSEGEYCEGFMISLFKYKGNLVGYLRNFDGRCADPPFGVLENITYVPSTGNFAFTAKYSNGYVFYPDLTKKVTDRTEARFKGTVSTSELGGIFSLQDMNTGKLVNEKHLTLGASKLEKICHDCMSYEEWDKYVKDHKDRLGW